MNDLFDILSLLCTVSLSTGLALIILWLFTFIQKTDAAYVHPNKKKPRYIEWYSVLLSLAIILLTAIIIFTPWQSILSTFKQPDYLYYIILFFTTFTIVLFFRVLAPIAISTYLLYIITFATLLNHSYSNTPQTHTIQITEPTTITTYSITLSIKNLLPLPRHWLTEPSINNPQSNFSLFTPTIESFKPDSIIAAIIKSTASLIIRTDNTIQQLTVTLEPPDEQTVEFSIEQNELTSKIF